MKLKLSTNQVVIEHRKLHCWQTVSMLIMDLPEVLIFQSVNTLSSPWRTVKITAFTKKLYQTRTQISIKMYLRELFFLTIFFVSLTVSKLQFSVFCLQKNKQWPTHQNPKFFFMLGSLFLFPLERLGCIMETELTVLLKHMPVLGSYWFRGISLWQKF